MAIINKPSDYFNTKLYVGNGSTQSITGVGFQPDWVWFKNRSSVQNHRLFDSVRGAGKNLVSNNNGAEIDAGTGTGGQLRTFDSDGFSVGSDNSVNQNTENIVAWNWKAGTSFTNDASGTGIGSIDSTGSFSNDSGFSIVTYTGTGSDGTIKHGLNAKPKIVFWKRLDNAAGAVNWIVQSTLFGNQTKLVLNTTEAFSTNSSFSQTNNWTSALLDLKTYEGQNASSGTYVAYCFAEKTGFSKFSSYIGNGNADGTFVYTGFKPAWVMIKNASASQNWYMLDNKRDISNVCDSYVTADNTTAEQTYTLVDFLSNGFKARDSGGASNGNGNTMIYMAFAQNPFVTSTGNGSIPATAR